MTDIEAMALESDDAPEIVDISPEPIPEPRVPGFVSLRMRRSRPEHEGIEWREGNLDYGPASVHDGDHGARNITFHNGLAVVPPEHPLLDAVMRKYPCEIVTTESRSRVFVDDEGREFKSKSQMRAATEAKKHSRKRR